MVLLTQNAKEKDCSVHECNEQKQSGDLLFCSDCRKRWRLHCMIEGIAEKLPDEVVVENTLKYFQENLLKEAQT